MIVPVGTWEVLRKCQPKSLGQTNFCDSKNACTLAGENACVFRLPVTKMAVAAGFCRNLAVRIFKKQKNMQKRKVFSKIGAKKDEFCLYVHSWISNTFFEGS